MKIFSHKLKQVTKSHWLLPLFFTLFILVINKSNAQVANCGFGSSGNMLVNPSFELPAFAVAQNNIITWPLQGWNGTGGNPNIVKTNNSFSGGGPLNSQSGTQYLDIAGSSADFWQTFEFSCYAQVYFSGYFSVRGNTASTGRIDIYKVGASNSLTLVASSNQLNMPNTMNIWYLSSGSATISPGTYRFQISMGDFSNFDNACFSYTPTVCFNTNTETGSAPSTGCTAIANVRANDSINNILASSSNSSISESGIWQTGISLNTTTGAVNVAAGTTPGKYFVTYNLCDLSTPTPNCKTQMDTVLVTSPISIPVSVCSSTLPYTWNGTAYNAAGTYNKTLTNAAGCDSVVTLVLTVKASSSSSTPVTVCSYTLPYTWNGTSYNASGTYTYTTTNALGCDSIATLVLTVTPKPNAGVDQTGVCAGSTATLTGTANTGIWSAMSSNPSGATLSTTTAGIATVSITSGVVVTFNFIYSIGSCTDTMSVSTILCCVKPSAGADQYTCPNNTVSLTGTNLTTGTWSALSTNGAGAMLSTTTAGVATVTLDNTVTGTYGFVYSVLYCTDTMNVTIGLTTNPMPAVNMGSNPICKNGTVQLCPTVWGWSNYQWYKNGVAIAAPTGAASCITLDSTGVGSYTVAASNGTGCWSSQSTAIVVTFDTTCTAGGSVTGGGSGGVESKTLGDVIAVRLYGNAVNSKTETTAYTSNNKFTHSGVIVNGTQDLSLNTLIPATVSNTDNAYVSTPTDLVNFTNAVEVLAVDYTKSNSIKAVAFGTKTLGNVYSHTKPICDRLKGAQLMEVKTINVNGYNVIAYKVQQCSGEVEYAMNLSAGTATNRNTISLQSNWFTDSYVQDEQLYNFQLWAVSYDMVKSMATDIINKLQANGSVNAVTTTDLPKAYVTAGNRKAGTVSLTINNNTTATTGYVELREKANETSQEVVKQVPVNITANNTSTVSIDVKDSYEATISLYINNNKTDMLYLNDGTWSSDYNKANTTMNSFVVSNEGTVSNNINEYRLLRNVNFSATTKDYVTVYKTIGTKCNALSLSNYNSLKFKSAAMGASSVTVTLISSSISNWNDQYSYTLNLDGSQEYAIGLNNFRSNKYTQSVNSNSITGVSFAFNNSRGVQSNMSASLSQARFSTATVAGVDNSLTTLGVYPNPTTGNRFNVNFSSNTAQSLVLKVTELATGRVVKTQFINATKGTNKQVIEVNSTQASGSYIVTLEGDDVKYTPAKLIMNIK